MAEPENHTVCLLREFREEFREFAAKTEMSFAQIQERLNNISNSFPEERAISSTPH
jgi:hypothetical protein